MSCLTWPQEGCVVAFKQDLDYWGIDELYLGEQLCRLVYGSTGL